MEHGILIVEDDADIREDLAELLRSEGYHVATAANGAEALGMLKRLLQAEQKPCVILLDLMMPVMDGWEFRAKQQTCPGLAEVPVVVLSGVSDIDHQATALRSVSYLRKPISLDRLFKVVAEHC